MNVPEPDRPKEHLPKTYRLRLSGWNAAQVNPDVLAAILLDEGYLKNADVWSKAVYYRLQSPLERFLSLDGLDTLHSLKGGVSLKACFDPKDRSKEGKIDIDEVGEESTRFMLQFVPPGATHEYVEKLLKLAGIEPANLEKHPSRADYWRGTTKQSEAEIPHYITGNFSLSRAPEDKKAILVTVQGRLIDCYYCGDSSHWTHKCQEGKDMRISRYKEREDQKRRREERREAARQEYEDAQRRQREREEEEDQEQMIEEEMKRIRNEEKQREIEKKREEDERVKEEKKKQNEEKARREKEAAKQKKKDEKEKKEEERKIIEAAIHEASAERESLHYEAPSPNESSAKTEGESVPVCDESLSYDRGLYGFNRDLPFSSSRGTPKRTKSKNKTIDTPNRRLFSDGDGERQEEGDSDDILTKSGSLKSYQNPSPKRRKVDGTESPLGLPSINSSGEVSSDPPEFSTPMPPEKDNHSAADALGGQATTPTILRPWLSPRISTPATWEDEIDNVENNLEIVLSPPGESLQTQPQVSPRD